MTSKASAAGIPGAFSGEAEPGARQENATAQGSAARKAADRLADLLALSAMPLFAAMALASLAGEGGAVICGMPPGGVLPGGMAPMYALMSLVHAGAWLRRLGRTASSPTDQGE